MNNEKEHHDTYIIPPNFIEGGTLFGGLFKIRNVIEAGILAISVGIPVFTLNISLTAKIIILCLSSLPLGIFGLLGIAGEPLSSFVFAFFKWLKKRRVISKNTQKKKKTRKKQTVESPFLNPVAEYLPIEKIENGIIYTKDHRYIKIVITRVSNL